jgi:hypothetical protein
MATTNRQDADFSEEMIESVKISNLALTRAIEWITTNLTPEQVYPESELKEWAEKNGYSIKED